MVEPTAHNGSDGGSTPPGPTNARVTICFRASPEEARRIDAAAAFDGKRTRAEWLRDYIMSMVEIVEGEKAAQAPPVCTVDMSRAPGLVAALASRPVDLSIGHCAHGNPLRSSCEQCAEETGYTLSNIENRIARR